MKPLSGIRILDISQIIAGPYTSYLLSLMGAKVIRVERIDSNDFVRYHGGTEEMRAAGLGASFVSQNAGKSCIQINLKSAEGKELFMSLVAASDVVLENNRPGVMDRLGVGYEAVKSVKPDIIFCSLTGYGPVGPLANAPAYDHVVQGISSLMSMTGTEESGPMRVGFPITDYIVGLNGVIAILSALRHRDETGEGQNLKVIMLASILSMVAAYAVDFQTTGTQRGLQGNEPFSGSPFAGRFESSDGHLVITANTAAQAHRMITAMNLDDLTQYADAVGSGYKFSSEDFVKIQSSLGTAFQTRTADEWEEILSKISVPAAKVRNLGEIMAHPQVAEMGCLDQVSVPMRDEPVVVPGLGFSSNAWSVGSLPSPEIAGQSTASILRNHGLNDDEIGRLARIGAISGQGLPSKAS